MGFSSHSEGLEYAKIIHNSMFCPIKLDDSYKKVKLTSEEIYVIMKYGEEFGFGPIESLNRISPAKGKLSILVEGLLSLCLASGKIEYIKKWYDPETKTAYCEIKRKDLKNSAVGKFSLDDAIKANLYGRKGKDGKLIPGPWVDYTERMLIARATGMCLKDYCSDLTRGAPPTEEVLDYKDYSVLNSEKTEALDYKDGSLSLLNGNEENGKTLCLPSSDVSGTIDTAVNTPESSKTGLFDYKDCSLSPSKEAEKSPNENKVSDGNLVSNKTLAHLNFLISHANISEELKNKWLLYFGVRVFDNLTEENAVKLILRIEKDNQKSAEAWKNI